MRKNNLQIVMNKTEPRAMLRGDSVAGAMLRGVGCPGGDSRRAAHI